MDYSYSKSSSPSKSSAAPTPRTMISSHNSDNTKMNRTTTRTATSISTTSIATIATIGTTCNSTGANINMNSTNTNTNAGSTCSGRRITNKKRRFIIKSTVSTVAVILFCTNVLFASTNAPSKRNLVQSSSSASNEYKYSCTWEPPQHNIPSANDVQWYKTIIAGYPSGDKRLTFMQLEALTGWAARDSWAYETFGMSNHPFIKTNFPHHDGVWGWDDAGDQVLLVVRNVRTAMVEFHNIMWDLGYGNTYEEVLKFEDNLYMNRPPVDLFLNWRDQQVLDEIHWYGFFIDYWMEEGLIRDVLTHKHTTLEHWDMLLNPGNLSPIQRSYETVIGNTTVVPTYDPSCVTKVRGGCHPATVISAERLIELSTGPAEARKIALTIKDKQGISDYLKPEDEWECLWAELIIHKKGVKTSLVRGGEEREYNFSEEMLNEMIHEYTRLITKYSSAEWHWRQTSKDLVIYFNEHLQAIQQELLEVQTGVRVLRNDDFLGPATRRKMNKQQRFHGVEATKSRDLIKDKQEEYSNSFSQDGDEGKASMSEDDMNMDYTAYFLELERKLIQLRRTQHTEKVYNEENGLYDNV